MKALRQWFANWRSVCQREVQSLAAHAILVGRLNLKPYRESAHSIQLRHQRLNLSLESPRIEHPDSLSLTLSHSSAIQKPHS